MLRIRRTPGGYGLIHSAETASPREPLYCKGSFTLGSIENESDIASRLVHRKFNLKFTATKIKEKKFAFNVDEP